MRLLSTRVFSLLIVFAVLPLWSAGADTTLFGPKQYTIVTDKTRAYQETVAITGPCNVAPAVYTLVVVHGAANGTGQVKSGKIRWNGEEIVSDKDLKKGVATLSRTIVVTASNALRVDLESDDKKAGSITITISRHIDLTTPVFGAKNFSLTTAKSGTFQETFAATDLTSPFSVVMTNGSSTILPVDDATITLNGVAVITKADIDSRGNQNVFQTIRRTVTLRAQNTLKVDLKTNKIPAGIALSVVRHVNDTSGPVIALQGLADGAVVSSSPLQVNGMVTDATGIASFQVNGAVVAVAANGAFQVSLPLQPGPNLIVFEATDCEGNPRRLEITVTRGGAPAVAITTPVSGTFFGTTTVAVTGTATDPDGVAGVSVNGTSATLTGSDWTATITLPSGDGTKTITATATDRGGLTSMASVAVALDTTGPATEIFYPPVGSNELFIADTPAATLRMYGGADDAAGTQSITCNGAPATLAGKAWECNVSLQAGANTLALEAVDRLGNRTVMSRQVTLVSDLLPPTIAAVVPPANAAGWHVGPLFVGFDCADESGPVICEPVRRVDDGAGQVIKGEAMDPAGHQATVEVVVSVDGTLPLLDVPTGTAVTNQVAFTIEGTASDAVSGLRDVTCGSVTAQQTGGSFRCTIQLTAGEQPVEVTATDRAGNVASRKTYVRLDQAVPVLAIESPANDTISNEAFVDVAGSIEDDDRVQILQVGGIAVALDGSGTFHQRVALVEGVNLIEVRAVDRAGNETRQTLTVRHYGRASLVISAPGDLAVVRNATTSVTGSFSSSLASVDVNGIPATLNGLTFTASNVPLVQGRTVVTATGVTLGGQVVTSSINVYRDSIPPRVMVYEPAANAQVTTASITVSGMVDDIVVGTINAGQVTVTVNGTPAEVVNRTFQAGGVALATGDNTLVVRATDQGGNTVAIDHHVRFTPPVGERLVLVSGNHQRAAIGATLSQQLRVRAVSGSGAPLAGRAIEFSVARDTGTVVSDGAPVRQVTVSTNAQGEAAVRWTLGTRAGVANQRVDVATAGMPAVSFDASATFGPAALLVVDAGNNQVGVTGERLPRPLVVAAVDRGSNRLTNVPVTFRIVTGAGNIGGLAEVTVQTDSDGRAWVTPTLGPGTGFDNNIISANVNGLPSTIAFQASAAPAGPATNTRISGVVLDNTNTPIAGVTMRVEGTSLQTQSDAQGQFVIAQTPVGYVRLIVDGSTAQRPGTWPMLEFAMYTNSGQDNTIGMPIYLLPIEVARGVQVSEQQGGVVTLPELPGFSLSIAPGAATFPGGSRIGTVSATLVHTDKVPMSPGFGQQPRFIVTIQPPGVHFDPPAALTLPNVEGLAPSEVTEMYSFDHDLGQFVAIGTATASADGATVQSDPGVGIIKGGWHCGGNPNQTGTTSCVTVAFNVEGASDDTSGSTAPTARRAVATNAVSVEAPKVALTNACIKLVATGSPAGGTFQWDTGSLTVISNSTVGTTSTLQVRANQAGEVNVKVTYTHQGQTDTKTRKIRFVNVNVALKELRFKNALKMYMDTGGVTPLEIADPIWKSTNTSNLNHRVALVGNYVPPNSPPGNKTFEMKALFSVDPPPPVDIPDVLIEGTILDDIHGFPQTTFRKRVTLKKQQATLEITDFDDLPKLPASTYFFDPMSIRWKMKPQNACSDGDLIGFSEIPLYVTLAQPQTTRLYYSLVHIATEGTPATTAQEAFDHTWNKFALRTVEGWTTFQRFTYYPSGTPFSDSSLCGLESLMVNPNDAGRCGPMAELLKESLGVNAIQARVRGVKPDSKPPAQLPNGQPDLTVFRAGGFLIKKMTPIDFTPPHVSGYGPDYLFLFTTIGVDNEMVPIPAGRMYGDILSGIGEPGQNNSDPSQKAFPNHAFVQLIDPRITRPRMFIDPSYGLEYADLAEFEQIAISAYYAYHTVPPPPGSPPNTQPTPHPHIKIARRPGPGSGVKFQ